MVVNGVNLPESALAEFCSRNAITRLALFGSVLSDRFRADSDVDILAEFAPGRTPGLISFSQMAIELERIIGRTVDLRTPADLSHRFRDEVLNRMLVLHAA